MESSLTSLNSLISLSHLSQEITLITHPPPPVIALFCYFVIYGVARCTHQKWASALGRQSTILLYSCFAITLRAESNLSVQYQRSLRICGPLPRGAQGVEYSHYFDYLYYHLNGYINNHISMYMGQQGWVWSCPPYCPYYSLLSAQYAVSKYSEY